jgi:hypothetical protein
MSKKNNNTESSIHIIELSAYTSPVIEENGRGEFVEYGTDNLYFNYLIDRYIGSTTNQAIINGITNMIYGKGIDALDSNKKPEQYAEMRKLLKPRELRRVISDRKKLGMGALQISYKGKKVHSVLHFPMETLRAGKCNDKGEVDTWYYHPDWKNYKQSDSLKAFPVFGSKGTGNEILIISSYSAGFKYYTPVDYAAALPYALLEEEIGDYLINDTLNGFSGTKVVNFNNGIPNEEKQRQIKRDVLKKITGSKGDRVIVAFNNNQESATTVTDMPLNDAPSHYQYLSDECRNKLITAHSVTSPLLLGIRDGGTGLSSNADEIKNASLFFDNIVIKNYQNEIIEALQEVLAVNDISLKLYFRTIQPLEFIDTDGLDAETKEEETGIKMSKEGEDFNDAEMLNSLEGETIDLNEWELVDTREYSEDNKSITDWVNSKIREKLSIAQKLSKYIKSSPNSESALDKSFYKIRYTYQEKYSSGNSREFCETMMSRTANGIVYRKEDIDQASFSGVNKSHGHKGNNYSLFKYKGGVNCGHYWQEELYRLKSKTEKYISKGEEVNSIPDSYETKGKQYEDAKIAPKDMPNNGRHPNNKR